MRCERVLRCPPGGELWKDWQTLLPRCRSELAVFGPAWYAAWSHHWGRSGNWTGKSEFLVVRDGQGRLDGIVPLAFLKKGPIRLCAFGGNLQPCRPVIAAADRCPEVGRAIGEFLVHECGPPLRIGPLFGSDEASQALVSLFQETGTYLLCVENEPLPRVELPSEWETFRSEILGSKRDADLRRCLRRMEELGDVTIEHLGDRETIDVPSMIQDLADIESRSWLMNDPQGRPRFISTQSQGLWSQLLTESLIPNQQFGCWLMRLNGQAISFVFTIDSGNVRFVIANQFDQEFKRFSPGGLLYREVVQDAILRDDLQWVDFGTGDPHYKQRWGGEAVDREVEYVAFFKPWQAMAVKLCRRFFDRPHVAETADGVAC